MPHAAPESTPKQPQSQADRRNGNVEAFREGRQVEPRCACLLNDKQFGHEQLARERVGLSLTLFQRRERLFACVFGRQLDDVVGAIGEHSRTIWNMQPEVADLVRDREPLALRAAARLRGVDGDDHLVGVKHPREVPLVLRGIRKVADVVVFLDQEAKK